MKFITQFVVVSIIVFELFYNIVDSACPNKCSGHGSCGANDLCKCQQNWIYGDCSGRVCPYTRAWIDSAVGSNDAHGYAECGNRGKCDRTTGECECDEGYTGSGCRRTACANNCNSHGTCRFIEDLANGNTYNVWDREKSTGCDCDPGYEGHICQFKLCPKGDDPLTTMDSNMLQYIKTSTVNLQFYLTYTDPYGNTYNTERITTPTTIATDADDTAFCLNVENALKKLPNRVLADITVKPAAPITPITRSSLNSPYTDGTYTAGASLTSTANDNLCQCLITFPSSPGTTGLQNLLVATSTSHGSAGHQPLISGATANAFIIGEAAAAADTGKRILSELIPCSGRGLCDQSGGICNCFPGHKGIACEKQEALV